MASALASSSSGVDDDHDVFSDDSFDEDACSICLEPFTSLDPPNVTKCKHEYHLHCILEWSQRSYECPICSQRLILKDPVSQELLAGVEKDKRLRVKQDSSPVHQNNEVNHVDAASHGDVSDFEQRIMRQFSAVASRARSFSRRRREMANPAIGSSQVFPSVPNTDTSYTRQLNASEDSDMRSSSEFHGFSESLKSKISTASAKYKESISKSTRGLKEKFAARNDSVKELTREVQREMTSSLAGLSKMMERLDFTSKRSGVSVPHSDLYTVGMGTSNTQPESAETIQENKTAENKNAGETVCAANSKPIPFIARNV